MQDQSPVALHGHERHGDVVDQRAQVPQLHLLLIPPLEDAVEDVGKCLTQLAETRTEVLEAEALRIIGVAGRIEEARHLAIRPADKPP